MADEKEEPKQEVPATTSAEPSPSENTAQGMNEKNDDPALEEERDWKASSQRNRRLIHGRGWWFRT